jgi:hypothetical protein
MKRWSLSLAGAGLLAIAALLLAGLPAQATSPPVPQINAKGLVVWVAYDPAYNHNQIYRWDSKTGAAADISKNGFDNLNPQINAKGQMAWVLWTGTHYVIVRWDPKTARGGTISPPWQQ